MKKRTTATTALGGALWLLATVGATQEAPVQIRGRVSWVSGETMVVALPDAPAVSVDLSQVPLDQYADLRPGDVVAVVGTVPASGRNVLANAVQRLGP